MKEKGIYVVFNYTDNIFATQEIFVTKKSAKKFIAEFIKRFENQGYYKTNRWEKINPKYVDLEIIPKNFNPYKTL